MKQEQPFKLALVSMPWAIFNRPSIQLAALKAYLDQQGAIHTTLFHPYLEVARGLTTHSYHYLAKTSWAGEALYGSLLFPERKKEPAELFRQETRAKKELYELDFDKTRDFLDQQLNDWLDNNDLASFQLIGFSVCFSQLLASLTAAVRIKEKYPDIPIVFGGSGCVAEIGYSLTRNFSQLDYVVSGEGEETLHSLCRHLQGKLAKNQLPGQIIQKNCKKISSCGQEIRDLNSLPVPDYSPYFNELRHYFPKEAFIPVLPIEFSRGCWWNKCTFCNLNLQWKGYRWKTGTRMFAEVRQLAKEHSCLDFTFCDNALPVREADAFFKKTAAEPIDYDFFAEIRVISKPEKIQNFSRGGLSSVQVGIEALSTSLLTKMVKGTSVIENIAAMKLACQSGMQLDGNLIVEFPGSNEEEVKETLKALDYVLPYSPLNSAAFFLGYGSPILANPKTFGIQAITQHPKNRKLFPAEILSSMEMLIKSYRGDRLKQRILWKPVIKKIQDWQNFHEQRKGSRQQALSYRDGKDFILIRQEQEGGQILRHRLQGLSRKIYLFCNTIKTIEEIKLSFPSIKESALRMFLADLDRKKLLFQEGRKVLSLAVPAE